MQPKVYVFVDISANYTDFFWGKGSMPSVKAHTMPDLANYKLRFRPKSASQIKNKKDGTKGG